MTAVINVAIFTGGTAHGSEITMEGFQRSDGGDGITWLHPPAIIIPFEKVWAPFLLCTEFDN